VRRRFFGRFPFAEPVLSDEVLRFAQNDKGSEGLRASARNKLRNLGKRLPRPRLAVTERVARDVTIYLNQNSLLSSMKNKSSPKYCIGCSGWHYNHWRGLYYPEGLAKSKWLQFYAKQFTTVELNNSFYHLPSEKAFSAWRESSPHNFVFAVKVSRFITHIKRLRNLGSAIENFLSRACFLENKLGPLLYQLPPNMKRNDEVLENFLSSLPQK